MLPGQYWYPIIISQNYFGMKLLAVYPKNQINLNWLGLNIMDNAMMEFF